MTVKKTQSIKEWIKDKDLREIQKLIDDHYILLSSMVSKYTNKNANFTREELMSEASLGLIRAATSFDSNAKVKFSTYAYFWIKNRILSYINSQNNVKSSEYNKHSRIVYDVNHLANINIESNPYNGIGKINKLDDELNYTSAFNVFLNTLNEDEREILVSRVTGKISLAELGKRLGYSRETVRQIEIKQINNFKKFMHNILKFENIYGYITCAVLFWYL